MPSQPEHHVVRFCPYCGAKTAIEGSRFCPFCGKDITGINQLLQPDKAQVQTEKTVMAVERSEQFAVAKQQAGDPNNGRMTPAAPGDFSLPASDAGTVYSVVIKSCSKKETLARYLETVLTRSFSAIRLAVERMPCIIIYKRKTADNITKILRAFLDCQASVAIVPGNLADDPPEQAFSDWRYLTGEQQQTIRNAPKSLWLGQMILGVYQVSHDSGFGTMVVTDQALCFLPEHQQVLWWDVPFYAVKAVCRNEASDGISITRQNGDKDVFLFAHQSEADMAYRTAEEAIAAGKRRLTLTGLCSQCGVISNAYAFDAELSETCSQCGSRIIRRFA